jgi:hypothetical protein
LQRSLKGKLVIGLAALVVAAFAGAAYAATQSSVPNTRQAFLNDVAKRLHVTPEQLTAALEGATQDQLQAAVKAGRLTQAQANALEQRLKQNGNLPVVPVPFGLFGPGGGLAPRFRAFPGPGPGLPLAGGLGAASYLGLTQAQLFQQLSSGKSLAQIATARGKSVAGLEQAMLAALKSRLDKLVTDKVITSAQEQQILNRFRQHLAQRVNAKGFKLPMVRGYRPAFKRPAVPGYAPAMPFQGKLPAPSWAPNPPAGLPTPMGSPAPTA